MTITKLTWGKKNKGRINVYLDEEFAFSVHYDIYVEMGLKKGMEISQTTKESLCQKDMEQKARQKALNLLSFRPHSQKELAQKLTKSGVDPSLAKTAVSYAAEKSYQSDKEYADMYARHLTKKGMSNRRIGWELSQKGVDKETIEEILAPMNDEEEKIRGLIKQKARRLPITDKKEKDRVLQSLLRMGYSYHEVSSYLSEYSVIEEDEE